MCDWHFNVIYYHNYLTKQHYISNITRLSHIACGIINLNKLLLFLAFKLLFMTDFHLNQLNVCHTCPIGILLFKKVNKELYVLWCNNALLLTIIDTKMLQLHRIIYIWHAIRLRHFHIFIYRSEVPLLINWLLLGSLTTRKHKKRLTNIFYYYF